MKSPTPNGRCTTTKIIDQISLGQNQSRLSRVTMQRLTMLHCYSRIYSTQSTPDSWPILKDMVWQIRVLFGNFLTFDMGMSKLSLNESITRVINTTNTTYAAFSKSVSCTWNEQHPTHSSSGAFNSNMMWKSEGSSTLKCIDWKYTCQSLQKKQRYTITKYIRAQNVRTHQNTQKIYFFRRKFCCSKTMGL